MNFLELVKQAKTDCGISGPEPSTVATVTGEMKRLRDWVRIAYIEIQNSQTDWNWLNKSAVIDLNAGGQVYHPVTSLGIAPIRYDTNMARLHDTSIGATDMQFLEFDRYDTAKQQYARPALASRATRFTVLPTREIKLNAILDKDYTLSVDYYGTAESLENDSDTPSMPEQYHMAIIYKTMMLYAGYEEAGSVFTDGKMKYDLILNQMLVTETPTVQLGRALA